MLKRSEPGLSTAGGQASLQTLVYEPDFATASFLLSVLGEGTFPSLLWFIERFAPDPITARVRRLAARDEATHVAFGMSRLRGQINTDGSTRKTLTNAVRERHDALQHTAGVNAEVFDALVLLAAESWEPESLRQGQERVAGLIGNMHVGWRKRLVHLGFSEAEAEELSSQHTRNYM